MKVQDFTGGLATRLRPQYIGTNEGVVYTNINSRVGSLAPVQAKLGTAIAVKRYHKYYIAKQEWLSADVPTDYLEYQKKMYFTDRLSRPQKYDGTNTYNLGITPPSTLSSFTINAYPSPVLSATFKADTSTSGLPVEDTYYALVNSDAGKYSKALVVVVTSKGIMRVIAEATTTVPDNLTVKMDPGTSTRTITISKPEGIELGIDGVQVFRWYKGAYYLVGTLLTDTSSLLDNVADISVNEALDESNFGALDGVIQYALTYYNSEDGTESALTPPSVELDIESTGTISVTSLPVSTDPQVDKKRLYRVGGNLTTFTLVTELANSATSYEDTLKDINVDGRLAETQGDGPAPNGLAFLTEAYAMLFGAVGPYLRFTPIGQPNNWPPLNFLTYEGDITGIAQVANGILVFTKFQTHLVTGTGPTSLSSQLLSKDQGCIAFESIVGLSGAAVWVSTDGICASNGDLPKVLSKRKLDKLSLTPVDSVIYDEVYYVHDADGTTLALDFDTEVFKQFSFDVVTLAVAEDELYGWKDGVMYQLYGGSSTASFKYLSPRFIEGRATELKTYKKVYIYSKGDIIIKIIIDDVEVCATALKGEDSHVIQVPVDKQRGHFIQFDISGTGEVYELEYTVGRRAND